MSSLLDQILMALPFLAGNMPNFEGVGGCTSPNTFKIRLPIPLIPVEPYLLGLTMQLMLAAAGAKLSKFHPRCVISTIFLCNVIAPFALCASQSNNDARTFFLSHGNS